jgi:CBS domain-containing protein
MHFAITNVINDVEPPVQVRAALVQDPGKRGIPMNLHDFLNTKISEVIVKDVVSFPPETRLADVALSLLRNQISGAPVIDAAGKCVGVISVVDVIGADDKAAEAKARLADEFFASSDLILPVSVYEDKLESLSSELSPTADQPISNFMVTSLVTASMQDKLGRVIEKMIDAHIHRVIVTNEQGGLEGLVSTTDILAALLRQGKEQAIS